MLDEEDMFCPNCGTEAPIAATDDAEQIADKESPATHQTTYNFTCRGCGASMSYDASAERCAARFVARKNWIRRPIPKRLRPMAWCRL